MGKAHKNVGAVVMIFVLVIGIAECRNLKEDEVVSGVGAVGRNYVVGFGDGRGGFIVSEPASGLGAGVGASGNAVGKKFHVVSEPASGLGAGVGAVGRNFVVVSEPASGLGFSSAASVGQGISGATAAGGGL
ncbi:hypothetical protein HN51_020128 [Arachis hypogaea]|uniref:Glycine-rich protein n=1 Tax=Arachis hypogaea TaxID=3818 RepID=A0A445BZE4_ARAHY|nr:fibroin heavy chain [Arachis hypogaea]QHO32008.1 uncharacterized protein DS421_8g246340 [Arachis hypogaea]RYR44134.1 hypothetical protein Ahy_A08g040519 isoform D [Arachis hypogaea]